MQRNMLKILSLLLILTILTGCSATYETHVTKDNTINETIFVYEDNKIVDGLSEKKENEIFTKLGYTDIQFLAPRIKAEVLMFTGLRDNICPPSTQFAAFNKITSKKEVKIFPDFGHEALPGSDEIVYEYINRLK